MPLSLETGDDILCVRSRLLTKTAKHCANAYNLILTSISYAETRPEKLFRRSSFALVRLCIYKTTLLLPTPMGVLHLYAIIPQHGVCINAGIFSNKDFGVWAFCLCGSIPKSCIPTLAMRPLSD